MKFASSVIRLLSIKNCLFVVAVRWIVLATICTFFFAANGFPQSQSVQAVDWSRYAGMTGVQAGDTFGKHIANVLQNQSHYLYGWINSHYATGTSNGVPAYSFTGGTESKVRPLAHFAWGNAVMLKTGIYDPAVTGLSRSDALHRTVLAIRGVAMTHRVNNADSKTCWGQGLGNRRSWQAAYWAAHGAEAAWMLWDSIGVETKEAVAKMVKYEADAFINYDVPYWKNADGTSSDPTDTKAEENAWNSRILTVAQAMMPNDTNVARWRTKASELMVSAYSRQSDLQSTALVDGMQVRQWIKGYNTFNDGVVINHGLAHPGYMACHTLTYETMIDATLAGQLIPQSAFSTTR